MSTLGTWQRLTRIDAPYGFRSIQVTATSTDGSQFYIGLTNDAAYAAGNSLTGYSLFQANSRTTSTTCWNSGRFWTATSGLNILIWCQNVLQPCPMRWTANYTLNAMPVPTLPPAAPFCAPSTGGFALTCGSSGNPILPGTNGYGVISLTVGLNRCVTPIAALVSARVLWNNAVLDVSHSIPADDIEFPIYSVGTGDIALGVNGAITDVAIGPLASTVTFSVTVTLNGPLDIDLIGPALIWRGTLGSAIGICGIPSQFLCPSETCGTAPASSQAATTIPQTTIRVNSSVPPNGTTRVVQQNSTAPVQQVGTTRSVQTFTAAPTQRSSGKINETSAIIMSIIVLLMYCI